MVVFGLVDSLIGRLTAFVKVTRSIWNAFPSFPLFPSEKLHSKAISPDFQQG